MKFEYISHNNLNILSVVLNLGKDNESINFFSFTYDRGSSTNFREYNPNLDQHSKVVARTYKSFKTKFGVRSASREAANLSQQLMKAIH